MDTTQANQSPNWQTHLAFTAAIIAAVLICIWGASASPQQAYDDAYITYRYADNLRRGHGLVYNLGEPVLGTTAPLFALLLGLFGIVVPNIEWLGHWFSVASWIVASWAAIAVFQSVKRGYAACIAGLLIALQPAIHASLGMETALVVALMLLSLWAWRRTPRWPAIALSSALILTRYDSMLWVILMGALAWQQCKRVPWREAIGIGLITLPWFVFAQLYYGSILPNSIVAKMGQTNLMPVGGQGSFLQMLWEMLFPNTPTLISAAFWLAIAISLWVTIRHERWLLWLWGWLGLYLAIYSQLKVAAFPWYFVPAYVVLNLLCACGLGTLLGDIGVILAKLPLRPDRILSLPARVVQSAFGLALASVLLFSQWHSLQTIHRNCGYPCEYREVGQWLANNTPINSRLDFGQRINDQA